MFHRYSKRKPKKVRTGKGKWVFVPDSSISKEELEQEEEETVWGGLLIHSPNPIILDEFHDYFPRGQSVPPEGSWILVKKITSSLEYSVPPLSIWWAEPWEMEGEGDRSRPKRVKVVTSNGELGVFPREYVLIKDVEKFFPFIGDGIDIHFFGKIPDELNLQMFYLRSRGISKEAALTMLLGQVKGHGYLWLQFHEEYARIFGFNNS